MKNYYTYLARQAIESYIKNNNTISTPVDTPKELIDSKAGVFVSIHKKRELTQKNETLTEAEEELRGCIGTIKPVCENIAEEIIHNAISACSEDYRFLPIKSEELTNLKISVDVLGKPESIDNVSLLNPKKYGVIVKSSNDSRKGLLLPDIEGIDTINQQLNIARQKAGISQDEPINLYRFIVTRYKE